MYKLTILEYYNMIWNWNFTRRRASFKKPIILVYFKKKHRDFNCPDNHGFGVGPPLMMQDMGQNPVDL